MLARYVIIRRKYDLNSNRLQRRRRAVRYLFAAYGLHLFWGGCVSTIITEKSFRRRAQTEAAEHEHQTELCSWKCREHDL